MRDWQQGLLLACLAAGWASGLMGQGWRSEGSMPVFRGTAAQELALTKMGQSADCALSLFQLRKSAAQFASDHNGRWPESWQEFTNYLSAPNLLYCQADSPLPPPTDWGAVDFSSISFELVSPGAHAGTDPNAVFARCRVHGNLISVAGTPRFARPYDYRSFPGAPSGKLVFPATTLATAKEALISQSCLNHLKELGLAARLFATDNQGFLPLSWRDLADALASPSTLYCPAELLKAIPTDFAQVDFSAVSYVLEAPGVAEDPVQRFARCRVHGHYLNTDGSAVAGTNRYPPRLILGHPLSQTLEPGNPGTLTVLTGDASLGPFQFQWRKLQPFDALGEPFTNTVVMADATNRTLVIPCARAEDEGYYDVVVFDAQGGYQLSAMAYVGVEPLSNLLTAAAWEADGCASNLRQIGMAARMFGNSGKMLPDSLAALPQYLGWPLVLYCPSDRRRVAPDSWQGVQFADTSYVLCRGVPYAATNNVLATCKFHGFQVLADATVITSGNQPLAPRLEVRWPSAAGPLVLTLHGLPRTECLLESSSDLLRWTALTTNLLLEGTVQLTDSLWLNGGRCFYRAEVR